MKAILIETILVIEAILFWAVALPAAFIFFKAAALWERIEASMPRGPIGRVGTAPRAASEVVRAV